MLKTERLKTERLKTGSNGPVDLFRWGLEQKHAREFGEPAPQTKAQLRQAGNLRRMISALNECRVLHRDYFKSRFGWDARACRLIAEASEGRIISFSGGYVLNHRATDAEFGEANGRIRSQAEKMLARADREAACRQAEPAPR